MKAIIRRTLLFIICIAASLALLCSCGSELDGTWRSRADSETRIRFSGENVRIYYDDFRIDGTYELNDTEITFHLTDKNGDKYKIVAKLELDGKKKIITLTNPKGETEVFEKR